VLRGADGAGVGRGPDAGVGLADWLLALVSVAGAAGLAAVGLRRGRLAGLPGGRLGTWGRTALGGLRALHSGHVGDSVTWLASARRLSAASGR